MTGGITMKKIQKIICICIGIYALLQLGSLWFDCIN